MLVPDFKHDFEDYEKFDIGAMGEFDVVCLVEQYAGKPASNRLVSGMAWRLLLRREIESGLRRASRAALRVALVDFGERVPFCRNLCEFTHAALQKGTIGHVVFEPGADDLVVAEPRVGEPLPCAEAGPVERHPLDLGRELGIVGRDRAALDRRDVLGHVERVRGDVAKGPDRSPAPPRPDRVRRVLDHEQPVAIPERVPAIHLERSPGKIDRHDRPRPGRDRRLRGVEIDQAGAGLRVDQHGLRPCMLDRVRGRDERHCRHQNLVPGPIPSTRIDRISAAMTDEQQATAVRHAQVVGQHLLEAVHLPTSFPEFHPERNESTTSAIFSCSPIAGLPKMRKLSRIRS